MVLAVQEIVTVLSLNIRMNHSYIRTKSKNQTCLTHHYDMQVNYFHCNGY